MYIFNIRDIKRELKEMDHSTIIEVWHEEYGTGFDSHVSLNYNGRTTFYQIGEEDSFAKGKRKALAIKESLEKSGYTVTYKHLQAVYSVKHLETLDRDRLLTLMYQHGLEGYEKLNEGELIERLSTYS